MKAREGDFIETDDGNIFDVKGLVHPPGKIIAFIRYTPDPRGDRARGGARYRKVYPLQERYELLRERFPQYLVYDPVFSEWLCEVPTAAVKTHYDPRDYLKKLSRRHVPNNIEKQAFELALLLIQKAHITLNALGVSGSVLVGLDKPASDIDLIVYGSRNCERIHETLKLLVKDKTSQVKQYTQRQLKDLFDFRSKDTIVNFEDFVRTESRKVLQGRFQHRDYFIRCIQDWNEIHERYGTTQYTSVGYAKIRATVTDDSKAILTPCAYKIGDVENLEGIRQELVDEIVSFRGRFCEQAKKDETIIAQGKLERLFTREGRESHRLLLGNRPTDYMIPSLG